MCRWSDSRTLAPREVTAALSLKAGPLLPSGPGASHTQRAPSQAVGSDLGQLRLGPWGRLPGAQSDPPAPPPRPLTQHIRSSYSPCPLKMTTEEECPSPARSPGQ